MSVASSTVVLRLFYHALMTEEGASSTQAQEPGRCTPWIILGRRAKTTAAHGSRADDTDDELLNIYAIQWPRSLPRRPWSASNACHGKLKAWRARHGRHGHGRRRQNHESVELRTRSAKGDNGGAQGITLRGLMMSSTFQKGKERKHAVDGEEGPVRTAVDAGTAQTFPRHETGRGRSARPRRSSLQAHAQR